MTTSSQRSTRGNAAADDHHGHRDGEAREEEEEEEEEEQPQPDLRRGPWTVDEDLTLVNYIASHGDGRWNSLARAAGLKRTGKSCRLRWLNYLRPDVKRGNFTADEQLLILDLHSRWGNRWSKIAQHLPGRTDNEIKNYWRTRVQKHAKQLNCDANSKRFQDAMRYLWMPHLADADHHRLLLQQQAPPGGVDHHLDVVDITAADIHALSGMVTPPSSSDSLASDFSCSDVRAGEMLVAAAAADGGAWLQEANRGLCSWPHQRPEHGDDVTQFQDPELSGWVQGFSEGVTDNFWTLEDVWKMQ